MSENLAVDPRVDASLQTVLDRGETGVAVAAYYRGKLIVNATTGYADVAENRAVASDTLLSIFSTTKGITALAVQVQAERGRLSAEEPISKHWPKFAANGKADITIEQALSHRAGMPQMPAGVVPELMADWDWMVKEVANLLPVFPPGTTNAYHVLVWGWILGEVVRRTDLRQRPFDVFVREEICDPLKI